MTTSPSMATKAQSATDNVLMTELNRLRGVRWNIEAEIARLQDDLVDAVRAETRILEALKP